MTIYTGVSGLNQTDPLLKQLQQNPFSDFPVEVARFNRLDLSGRFIKAADPKVLVTKGIPFIIHKPTTKELMENNLEMSRYVGYILDLVSTMHDTTQVITGKLRLLKTSKAKREFKEALTDSGEILHLGYSGVTRGAVKEGKIELDIVALRSFHVNLLLPTEA